MNIKRIGFTVTHLLNQPKKIAIACFIFVTMSAVFNGVLWRLWALHTDQQKRQGEIVLAHQNILRLRELLTQATDPVYIEKQARDRLDLAGEKDLVFVFPTQ